MKHQSNILGSDKSLSYSLMGGFGFYYFTFGSRNVHER